MRALLLLVALATASGCFTTRYLVQAAGGQVELLRRARPLRQAIADPTVPPHVRALLEKVPAIKRFGQHHGLTPTRNYERYADLRRPAAVWVVQGCAALAFEPRRWAFPLVGSVPYLGFFDEGAARAYAAELAKAEALDVAVRPVSAYSTLGWFADPVLSTMLPEGPQAFGALANVILHESVHATVYVPDQSAFDESLASFIADALTWDLVVGRAGLHSPEAQAWMAGEARAERFRVELHRAFEDLDALYRSSRPDEAKRAAKAARLEALQRTLGLSRRLNNADLAGSRTYDTGHEALARLRQACGGLPGLLRAVRTLTERDFTAPQQRTFDDVVDRLAARECPAR